MSEGQGKVWLARRVLGWRLDALAGFLAVISIGLWGLWLTRAVVLLEERRVVSVSLQSLVENYIAETARQGAGEEDAQRRTRAYLAAVEAAVASLDDGQTIVLVSEAVLGRTVPDVTPAVEAAVTKAMAGGEVKERGHAR